MEFKFTEGDYTGARKFGGQLAITAQGAQEVESIISHFRLFKDVSDVTTLQARIAALQSETLTHVMQSDKRPMYEVATCLDYEFTEPYKTWARDCFGYDGVFPDLEIPRKWNGLMYSDYRARLYTEGEHICVNAFTSSEPWNGKDAQEYAESCVKDYLGEEFGTRRREPEYIHLRNGMAKPNPDYMKRHRPTPLASNSRLKRAFFDWWMINHASAAQKEIVAGNAQIVSETGGYMDAFRFEGHESHIYHGRKLGKDGKTRDYKSVTFAEFAKLGNA